MGIGVAATLWQKQQNEKWKAITHHSRTFSKSEKNYSQIEAESLAIVFGITRNKLYLYGLPNLPNTSWERILGSILGPLLFIFYINDLPEVCNVLQTLLFADDTILSYSSPKIPDLITTLNDELTKLETWTNSNMLAINVNKTQVINFSNMFYDYSPNPVKIGHDSLDIVTSCRYLGVQIDNKLTYSDHIKLVNGKIAKSTGILYKITHLLPLLVRLDYYYAFIYPYLSYCVIVWGATYPSHLYNLIVQPKKIIRIISDAPYLSHSSPLFHNLKILKFEDAYR